MPENEVVYAMIGPDAGPVTVTLRANNALMTGSDFALWASDGTTQCEEWRMSTEAHGTVSHELQTAPASLLDGSLTWRVVVCSSLDGVDTGTVEVVLTQGGVTCATTKPLRWDLEDIPLCASGDVIPIPRGVTFRKR